jgi:UDP-N-acetylmuramoylalanine--D-glutamate ligase
VSLHPDDLRGRRVLVLGLGAFGGGSGAAAALARRGARVTVTDLRPLAQLEEARAELAGLDLRWEVGGHREDLFAAADAVVVNPAVPRESPWLEMARRHGCALTDDVSLALAQAAAVPSFAVTGTHGKSSCAALAAHLLGALPGRTVLAGNLGGSLLERVQGLGPDDRLVVEISSFQAEALEAPRGWPRVAALTCLRSDHLDRHGTLAAYAAAKRRLLEFQDAAGVALVPADDPEGVAWAAAARGEVLRLDPALWQEWGLDAADLPFPEPFRLPSALAAVAAALRLGLPHARLRGRLRSFRGLPHRMEDVPAPPGCRIVDNGVATHPEPTEAALRHLAGSVVLLAGGKDKGLPLADLAHAAARCARGCRRGPGGSRLAAEMQALGSRPLHFAAARPAMAAALAGLQAGETLLFSPSFSSFDEYRNFRDRALVFRDLCAEFVVRRVEPGVAPADQETRG